MRSYEISARTKAGRFKLNDVHRRGKFKFRVVCASLQGAGQQPRSRVPCTCKYYSTTSNLAMALPPRFLNSVYDTYQDDDTVKEVNLQAHGLTYSGVGDRHVLLQWKNATTEKGPVMQIVQLTGQSGNYSYYVPVAQVCSEESMINNQLFSLGEFSRAQRDEILDLANQVFFSKTSTTNGCRVWTRELLMGMVQTDLISREKFDELDVDVPLVRRVADE